MDARVRYFFSFPKLCLDESKQNLSCFFVQNTFWKKNLCTNVTNSILCNRWQGVDIQIS